jgi:hypothetical protein
MRAVNDPDDDNLYILADGSVNADVPRQGIYLWVLVSPEMAEKWLARNLSNRRLRPTVAQKYAADMAAGLWVDRDPVIKVTVNGELLDGQHECTALVAVAEPMLSWVHVYPAGVRPLDLRVDTGLIRSVGDIFGIGTNLAATARALYVVATGSNNPSRDQIRIIAEKIGPEFEHLPKTTRQGFTMSPVLAAYCYSMWRFPDDADEMVAQYGAVAREEYGTALWPGTVSAAKQVMERSAGRYRTLKDVFLRTARGLDPEGRQVSKVSFKDQDIYHARVRPFLRQYIGLDEE